MLSIKHGERKKLSLDDIFNGPDEFGLLNVKAKHVSGGASLEVSKFEEVNTFIDKEGRQPSAEGELAEKLLARRLQSYIDNTDMYPVLSSYDRHNLLVSNAPVTHGTSEPFALDAIESGDDNTVESCEAEQPARAEEVTSLDDIFSSDIFAQMDQGDQSLFDMTHVPLASDRDMPDEIAQQTHCADFYKFESIFKGIQAKLKSGELQHVHFQKELQIREGDAFIMEGVVCLIDEVGEYKEDNFGRPNPRLRIIFENGTESNHLLRSFGRRMYKDKTSRRIIQDADAVVDAFNNVSHKDKRAGQIYFVTTMSDNPALRAIPSLIKIGYTEQTVEERTKNAERDTAFLEAPVKILASMECYNLNPNKFESLIHGFLYAQRLRMTLVGRDGKSYHPNEWFSVSLEDAMEAARRIIDGSIVKYRMDNTTGRLVPKVALA